MGYAMFDVEVTQPLSDLELSAADDGAAVLVRTRSLDQLYMLINRVVLEDGLTIEGVTPADDDVHSVYSYLIGTNGTTNG